MNVLRASLCVLLLALAACDGDKPGIPQPPRAPQVEEEREPLPPAPVVPGPQPSGAAPAESPSPPPDDVEPAPHAAATAVAPHPALPVRAARAARPEALPPLDLSLPDELLEPQSADRSLQKLAEAQPLLPPLFGGQADDSHSFELGGRLITNEHSEEGDSWRAVEGAELELRFRR